MRKLLLLTMLAAFAAPAAPGWAQTTPRRADPKAEMDNLLMALKAAPTEDAAAALEARIKQSWMQAGGPAAALLLNRGLRNLANNDEGDALDDFNAALVLEPEFTEAFHRRAAARAAIGDYRGALIDIQETLKREPRHFAAWQSLSRIAEARGDASGALAAWQKALEIDPRTPHGQDRLKELRKKVLGEES
jgi:tetratricopeptide (TPR) repeat protein